METNKLSPAIILGTTVGMACLLLPGGLFLDKMALSLQAQASLFFPYVLVALMGPYNLPV